MLGALVFELQDAARKQETFKVAQKIATRSDVRFFGSDDPDVVVAAADRYPVFRLDQSLQGDTRGSLTNAKCVQECARGSLMAARICGRRALQPRVSRYLEEEAT